MRDGSQLDEGEGQIQEDFLEKEPFEMSLEGLVGFQEPGCPKIIFKNTDSSWKNYQRLKHHAEFN